MSDRNPFRRASFRQWYAATTLLAIGTSTTLAVTLLLVDLTKNVALAGVISSLILAVELIAGPIGGGLADIVSRKKILLRALTLALFANAAIVATLFLLPTIQNGGQKWMVWLVIGALVLSAAATGVADPALDASARSLISPGEFPRAMSAEHARSSTLQIVGNPLSGGLYAIAIQIPFVLRLICDMGFVLTLKNIKRSLGPSLNSTGGPPATAPGLRNTRNLFEGYHEAFKFLRGHRVLRRILIAAPLVNLLVFSGTSWTVLHLAAIRMDPFLTGIAAAGFAIGGLLGSSVAPRLTDSIPPGILAIGGLSWMAIAFLLIFMTGDNVVLIFVIAIIAMLPSPSLNGGLFGHVFSETSDDMQGRVMATFSLMGGLSSVIAPALAGLAVKYGLDLSLAIASFSVGVIGVLVLATSEDVRRMPLLS
ncbi:MFS transporter [Micrococcus luteus]|uniref:MFS transporter n=1 Tax=Micrococcus luteus TaxID=1270 RepID=UPI002103739C|nr:MFS transporter [Micrococcus luteus]UTX34978.1 MFS transporter [Micrococcus luteus]